MSLLFLGAHSDDIEIGCGGLLSDLKAKGFAGIESIRFVVLSGNAQRKAECEKAHSQLTAGAPNSSIDVFEFEDTRFPAQLDEIKQALRTLAAANPPDLIFTHYHKDAHQDHRTVCEATYNVFRGREILEYEIPKWDGDLDRKSVYYSFGSEAMSEKCRILQDCFSTQRSKQWFDEETFRGLARLRGVECNSMYAEAFYTRKLKLNGLF